jgi:hypothetical protein
MSELLDVHFRALAFEKAQLMEGVRSAFHTPYHRILTWHLRCVAQLHWRYSLPVRCRGTSKAASVYGRDRLCGPNFSYVNDIKAGF